MSTDTDEECAAEGRAGTETGIGNTETSSTALVPSTSLLLITANVGSVFEDAEALAPKWRHEVTKFISEQNPQFVAIHFQEVRICFACGSPSTELTLLVIAHIDCTIHCLSASVILVLGATVTQN